MESSVLEEKVFHKVMKNVPFGLVVSGEGRERKVYYVNQMAYHMLGYTREEYIKKVQGGWSQFLDIDLREVMRDHHEEILTGEPFELTALTETKDGNKKWLSFRVMVSMELKPVSYITITDVTEKVEKNRRYAREREYLKDCAARDSMTRLLNRGTMEERIKEELEAVEEGQNYAYIALDLDNFKQINDMYGHWAGDSIIMGISNILREVYGNNARIGRMGGDEFAVFIPDVKDRAQIQSQADEVLRRLRLQKEMIGMAEEPTASIGIAFGPADGRSFRELYHRADEALYQVKNEEKNSIAIYTMI
ncbi:diguanylate cyclase [Roseburia sp. OF03-24]|jgi:diguanylate cyclase (GGDEF)-like protein/PAS domain S-box-containing protein|uniref:sensor domain-containing diguanylate cyclase n=1 Tax=Roseburia sp. OF03-24 TaxID=2292367 RepID=UPI000E46CF98|nr:sensor domain-containing diguanylate cyclase [Roseburia sp. OF03-24]RGX93923.1 diguanylate cyclase [Roseburia sp. OF03-24]